MNREEAGLVQAVREKLQEEAEENYRIFQAGLLPGVNNLLGVRLGTLRKIARTIARKSPYIYLEAAPDVYFEEDMLCGMLIGYVKMEEAVRKRELKRFVPRIGNWSVCDSCCASWHFMKEKPGYWWEFLQPYFESEQEYEVRFALVCGLDYFIREDYIDAFLERLKAFSHPGYYARMAAAWAISICYIRFREKTERFLEEQRLDEFTRSRAIQKIRESRCVSGEEKAALAQRYRLRQEGAAGESKRSELT